MEPFIGQIMMVGFNFAPRGWAFCNGQLLSIAQNTALFSLLGTTYGGDGRQTFGLPDMRSRVPIGMGQGPGLSSYNQGQVGGEESNTLAANNLPQHNHNVMVSALPKSTAKLKGNFYGIDKTAANNTTAIPTDLAGSNQPIDNMPPYVACNYIIALEGIFPSRS